MAKFLKSIFQSTETHRSVSYEETGPEEEPRSDSSMEVRRQLSISRSGRMRQAQKKRLSLHMDIYGGEDDLQQIDRPKAMEYHVSQKTQARENPLTVPDQRRRSRDSKSSAESIDSGKVAKRQGSQVPVVPKAVTKCKDTEEFTPDEEIDSAFEVIDKTL